MSIIDKLFIRENDKKVPPSPIIIPTIQVEVTKEDLDPFNQHFKDLFESLNLPGPDYFEFTRTVDSMDNSIPYDVKIKAAFSALSLQGLDKTKLISSANQYLQSINDDRSNFFKTLNDSTDTIVNNSKKALAELQSQNDKDLETIAQLQKAINSRSSEIERLSAQVTEASNKVSIKQSSYDTAANSMQNRISKEIEIINNLIQ